MCVCVYVRTCVCANNSPNNINNTELHNSLVANPLILVHSDLFTHTHHISPKALTDRTLQTRHNYKQGLPAHVGANWPDDQGNL